MKQICREVNARDFLVCAFVGDLARAFQYYAIPLFRVF
jgi:hypothetical protein